MNMASVIAAGIFLVLSVALFIFILAGKSSFFSGKYKVFYLATCGVYISGTLLVLIFSLLLEGLPVAYVLISNATILFVFVFTCGLIRYLTKTIVEAAEKAGNRNDEGSERKEN